RETDPVVRTDQTQSHGDRLIEQPFVLWIEITQARCLLAPADRKLALLHAVSDTTKIGYTQACGPALACFGRTLLQGLTEMPDRLFVGVVRDRPLARDSPVTDRLMFETTLTEMVCKLLRPSFNDIGKLIFEDDGNALVEMLAATAQQSTVGSILNKGMF